MTDASARDETPVDTETSASTALLGTVRAENGVGVVHLEDVYDTDIDDLWSAITTPSRLARWAGQVDGELAVGKEFHVVFTSGWDGTGRVDACEPPHHVRVTQWSDDDGPTVIDATLVAEGDRTRLIVENSGLRLNDFHFYAAGWQAHLEDLGHYLADRAPSDWGARADQLAPGYDALAAVVR